MYVWANKDYMRKGQKNILEKAKKLNLSEAFINILLREDLTISELESVYNYMWHFKHSDFNNENEVIGEINSCLDLKALVKRTTSYQLKFDKLLSYLFSYGNKFIDIQEKQLLVDFNNTYTLPKKVIADNQHQNYYSFRTILNYYCLFIKANPKLLQSDVKKLLNMLEDIFEKELSKAKKEYSCYYIYSCGNASIYSLFKTPLFLQEFSKRQEDSLISVLSGCNEENQSNTIIKNIIEIALNINILEININYRQFIGDNNIYNLDALHTYMEKIYVNNNPILKQFYSVFPFECENSYKVFSKKIYEDEEKANLLLKTSIQLGKDLRAYKFNTLQYTIIIYQNYINIDMYLYSNLEIFNGRINIEGCIIKKSVVIMPNGYIYIKNQHSKNKKIYPMFVSDFIEYMKLLNQYEKDVNIFNMIWDIYEKSNYIFKDIRKDILNSNCLIPLNINELGNFHNRSELIMNQYKAANNLKIQWNKININLAYMIIKSLPYVDEKGKQILLNTRDTTLLTEDIKGRFKSKVKNFLINIICKSIKLDVETEQELTCVETGMLKDEDRNLIRQDVQDYVNMCLQRKIKIKLNIKTINELKNRHDLVNAAYYEKETGIVKIPKNTIFKDLEKILPEGFEWIKTRKRLILETKLQHHCVWSYANKITEDKCAIYSYIDREGKFNKEGVSKRYTIEFNYENGRYIVNQVQGQYDKINCSSLNKWLKDLLAENYAD